MEIHRAFGTDYKTVAACQLKFRDLLEKPHGRVHSTAKFIGANRCSFLGFEGSVSSNIQPLFDFLENRSNPCSFMD